jgi:hypothetical protein
MGQRREREEGPPEGAAVYEWLIWSRFMLQALLKQCLAMPIHNSESKSESK